MNNKAESKEDIIKQVEAKYAMKLDHDMAQQNAPGDGSSTTLV